jgi:hypothetical protein
LPKPKLKNPITCDEHGTTEGCFVCQHLIQSKIQMKIVGFFAAEDSDSERPDAWCTACDKLLMKHNGNWDQTVKEFSKTSVVCSGCYDWIKEFNGDVRGEFPTSPAPRKQGS